MLRVLDDSGIEVIADGVLHILENLGFNCKNQEILKAYDKAGAEVDYEAQVAKFPAKMIKEFVEHVYGEDKSDWHNRLVGPNKEAIFSGYQPYAEQKEFVLPPLPYMFHNTSPFF